VRAWGLEILCQNPAEYSAALTAVVMPKDAGGQSHNADALRKVILNNFNMSLGQGLTKLSGWVFRIGHLGDFNDLALMGALSGVEMGLAMAGVPHRAGGVTAAMQSLRQSLQPGAAAQTKGA
jgi:alanine-glyoxylate transaminase/serine-glyoxylate transaminase/serine-pyruvate transaminase